MKYLPFALLPLLLLASACDQAPELTFEDVPLERFIAFTAVYAQTTPGGAPIQRIVVADFENPSLFRVISREEAYSRA